MTNKDGTYEPKDDSKKEIAKGIFIGYCIIFTFAGIICMIDRWVI